MTSDIVDIDHLMLSVQNSDRAMDIFSRMGFTITPRGVLEGMSNRLICFAGKDGDVPNFVEMMSLDDPELAPPAMAHALKIPDRAVLLVAASANAQNTRDALIASGIEVSPVIDTGRDWKLPSGEVLDLTFSIVLPSPGQAPFYWIACQHKTPQHYLRSVFTDHKNGGLALKNIIAVAKDPGHAAAHFAKSWQAKTIAGQPVIVQRKNVQLHIYDNKNFNSSFPDIELSRDEDHIVGFTVAVKDLSQIENQLLEAGFFPEQVQGKIVLDPSQACGCMVVFEVLD